ncbi:MAG: energy-coupling factor transporter transmembrane protein EcfT [Nitrososphaeria archaeon]|nr:energy-coupling factor transporter transmembrane protein EcfT [Nitrososphaeria archaeon]
MSWVYGLYKPGKSIMHRLDARVKLVYLAFYFAIIGFFTNPIITGIIYLSIFPAAIIARVSLKRLILTFYTFGVVLIVSLLMWPSYYRDVGVVIFNLPIFGEVTDYGFMIAVNNVFKIVTPITAFLVYISVTKPYDIVQSFIKLRLPYKVASIVSIALRFLPVTFTETKTIIEAQAARGLDLSKGNILVRLKKYTAIFIPLIVRMLKMNVELAMSLEARCFGAYNKRTFINEMKMRKEDLAFLVMIISAFIILILLRYLYNFGVL